MGKQMGTFTADSAGILDEIYDRTLDIQLLYGTGQKEAVCRIALLYETEKEIK